MRSQRLLLIVAGWGLLALGLLPMRKIMRADSSPPEQYLVPPVSIEKAVFPTYTGCGSVIASVVNADYEQQVVELVNTERASRSLPPFKRVTALDQAARYHATDMGQDDYFSHDSYDRVNGSLAQKCSWSARITSYYSSWNSLAENIAAGYSTPQSVMNAWMNSSGHRANILSTGNWEIGVGYYQGSGSYGVYWVQDFGRRSGVYPLVVNREAATASSRDVSIYIYGNWQDMRLRNDNGDWTNWQPFQSNFNWKLACGQGDHTVTAELRSGSTVVTSSDSIYLAADEAPALSNVPDAVTFAYSTVEQKMIPGAFSVIPQVGCASTMTWTVAAEGTWFIVSPTSGATPASFSITPTDFVTNTATTYSGAVTVTATNPPGVIGSPHRINLALQVFDSAFEHVYLPVIWK